MAGHKSTILAYSIVAAASREKTPSDRQAITDAGGRLVGVGLGPLGAGITLGRLEVRVAGEVI